ncbi:MAG: hypothetical protein ABW277_05215 [Longimicrobiaceae bacterium]
MIFIEEDTREWRACIVLDREHGTEVLTCRTAHRRGNHPIMIAGNVTEVDARILTNELGESMEEVLIGGDDISEDRSDNPNVKIGRLLPRPRVRCKPPLCPQQLKYIPKEQHSDLSNTRISRFLNDTTQVLQ